MIVSRRGAIGVGSALALAALGAGCGETPEPDPRPNVLIVTLDTTRADHTSAYGYERATTPVLAALARDGARFARAYAPTATTAPTHVTMLTSLYPLSHGVLKNGIAYAAPDATLAEILAAQGYQTAAVVSSFVMNAKFGYGRGFDHYDDDLDDADVPAGVTEWEGQRIEGRFQGRADDTTRRARRWLDDERDPARPFLLLVHYYDPHDPYSPPPPWNERFVADALANPLARQIALYDGEIAYTDHELGRLLDALDDAGLRDRTLVVVAGDHGEGLMQHGHMYHGIHVYEEAVRVPLVLRGPGGFEPGTVIEEPVQLIDVAPTVLDLIGAQADAARGFQGQSLAPALRRERDLDPDRSIFLHRRHYEPGQVGRLWTRGQKFAVRSGRWKYIEGPEEGKIELFDLESDPGERANRRRHEPDRLEELARRLADWRAAVSRPGVGSGEIAPEDRARLRALGYIE